MKELQRKQKLRKMLYSTPSFILIFIISFILAKGAIGMVIKEYKSASRIKELEGMTAGLTLREQELKVEVGRLKTEEGLKEEIRERFNVTEEGESMAIIVEDNRRSSSTDDLGQSWYKRLWAVIIRN